MRDHFLGVTAVSGRGETFKSGGRVVKNVTGYDLCKLLAGSWGTLGIMTDVTLKVLPQPETEATLVLFGLNEREAGEAMTKAMGSSFDVSGAAHMPDYLAARLDGVGRSDAATLLRIEGIKPSVAHRIEGLERELRPIRAMAKLDERASRSLWRAIRDAKPLAADTEVGAAAAVAHLYRAGAGLRDRRRGSRRHRSCSSTGPAASYGWRRRRRRIAAPPQFAAPWPRWAGMPPWCAGRRRPGPPSTCSSRRRDALAGADQARQGELRSQGRAQPRADVGGRIDMQTSFSLAQLADPDIAEADKILRACVHCGFCTATCPTYLLLGDEDDSPRGRIYLIKDMLEKGEPARREVVKHIDRCLSCLSCMTTCPSGVHYMHLVDHARAHMEKTYRRPYFDRLMRAMLAQGAARSEAVPDGAVCALCWRSR